MERIIRRGLVVAFLLATAGVVAWMLYAASLREDSRANWVRRRSMPGGWPATFDYLVYGDFATPFELKVDRKKHRCRGKPAELEVRRVDAGAAPWQAPFDDARLSKALAAHPDRLEAAVASSTAAVVVRGTVAERQDLGDLQDTIGVVSALLDQGGIAVLDLEDGRWWSPREWRAAFLDREGLSSRDHVAVVLDGGWLRTRGMRRFGRPEISIRGIPPGREADAVKLANRLVDYEIDGGVLDPKREIQIEGLPPGMRTELHAEPADFEDPEFRNCRLEVIGFK